MNIHKESLKRLRKEIETDFKAMSQKLYRSNPHISTDELRLEILKIVTNHVAEKSKVRLARKIRTKKINTVELLEF